MHRFQLIHRRALIAVGMIMLLLASSDGAPAAQTLSASASVSPSQVAVGQTVTYTLTIRGGTNIQAAAPEGRDGLRLRSPQPSLDVRSSVNGRNERKLAWTYEAVRAGTGIIAPARIEVDRATLEVDAARVLISASSPGSTAGTGASPNPAASSELFVRAEPSVRSVVVGQQVMVDYVLYFEPHLQPRQTAPIGTWDAPGFWREEMDIPTAYPRPTTFGGKPYEAVTIRRIALFPTRNGTLALAPMQFSVDLLRTSQTFDDDPFAPFFSPFSSSFDEEKVTADLLNLTVRLLPDGAPDTFDGAVGTFELASRIDRKTVEVGDPIQLSVSLDGTGNIATIAAPTLRAPPGFDVYDPREEQEILKGAEPLRGTKTFTYTLVPQGGGQFDLPAIVWTYFDPGDGTYKSLRSDAYSIEVDGPPLAERQAADTSDPTVPDALMTEARWGGGPMSPTVLWSLLAAGVVLPLALAFGIGLVRVRRERASAAPDVREERDAAPSIATLRELHGPQFYAEASRCLRHALYDEHAVALGASRSQIADVLSAKLPDPDTAAEVDALLALIDHARFTPVPALDSERDAIASRVESVVARLGTAQQIGRFRFRRPRSRAGA